MADALRDRRRPCSLCRGGVGLDEREADGVREAEAVDAVDPEVDRRIFEWGVVGEGPGAGGRPGGWRVEQGNGDQQKSVADAAASGRRALSFVDGNFCETGETVL